MISIVIVNWNAGVMLERCIRSLQQYAGECDILVVDNASDDGSLDFTATLSHPLSILRNQQNLGFAAANNMGWRRSRGELVLFLNPDTECRPGSVTALATSFESPSVWAVGGKLLDPSGEHQAGFNVRAFPTVGCVAADMLLLDHVWPGNPWSRKYRMAQGDFQSVMEVDQPAAACLMVRHEVLETLHGFDEAFHPAWFEDVDLCRRIWEAGGRILFQPHALFHHQGGVSLSRIHPEEFLIHFHSNQLRYFAKHHGEGTAQTVRRLMVAGIYLRALLSRCGVSPRIGGRRIDAGAYLRIARQLVGKRRGEP